MPGRTPREAFDDYVEPLRDALHGVTQFRLTLHEMARLKSNVAYAVNLNKMMPVLLQGDSRIRITVAQVINISETKEIGSERSFEVDVLKYFYRLSRKDGKELLGFHWTPDTLEPGEVTFPHLQLGPGLIASHKFEGAIDLHKVHVPTGQVSLASIVRMAIAELGVKPIRSNWEHVLERSERAQ